MRYRVGLETRTKILAATRDLVAEVGPEGTTIKAICDRAGILAGSFYNLFASKEEAIFTVVGDAIRQVEPETGHPTDLRELVAAYVEFVRTQEAAARVYLMMAVTGGLTDERVRERMLRHHCARADLFAAALSRHRPELDSSEVRAEVEVLLAALNGLAFRRLLDPRFDLAGHAQRLAATSLVA